MAKSTTFWYTDDYDVYELTVVGPMEPGKYLVEFSPTRDGIRYDVVDVAKKGVHTVKAQAYRELIEKWEKRVAELREYAEDFDDDLSAK